MDGYIVHTALIRDSLTEKLFPDRFSLSKEQNLLYQSPSTVIQKLARGPVVNGSGAAEAFTQHRSLFDATSLISKAAVQASEAPLSFFVADNEQLFLLMANIMGTESYLTKLNDSTILLTETARNSVRSIRKRIVDIIITLIAVR